MKFGLFVWFYLVDAPVCSSSAVMVIGASLEEAVSIPCRVNSDPPDIDFEWTFSSSGEHFEVPSGHFATIQEATTMADIHRTIITSNDTYFDSYGMCDQYCLQFSLYSTGNFSSRY